MTIKQEPITDEDIRWLMDNPLEAKYVLLGDFCRFLRVFHFYMTRSQFDLQPFHYEIGRKLVSYMKGTNEKQNLYIGISPRAGKSQIVIDFIAYAYAANPFSNFIYTSYSNDLCVKHSKKIRDIVESPLFQTVFGLCIDQNTAAANLWKISGGGEFRSVPMAGSITGFGAGTFDDRFGGAILVDDFMKADNYKSKVEKQNAIDIFENTLRSRKNRPSKDPTIIIAQRLSKDDLIDYIKEKYPDEWDFFVIPALNEETGESFWEERYPAKMLLEMKEQNPYLFYSQYQQEPITLGGGVYKHEWWQYYKDTNVPFRKLYITADTAMKTNEWNDFTAIGVWGLTNDNKLYLLDMVHGKFEAPELESAFISLWKKWQNGIGNRRISAVYIEDKASGTGLIQSLRRKGGLPIVAITPEKDKLSRAMDCVGYVASGCVYLPESENHPISREFLAELDAFSADGSAPHDDITDMTNYSISQAYNQRGLF